MVIILIVLAVSFAAAFLMFKISGRQLLFSTEDGNMPAQNISKDDIYGHLFFSTPYPEQQSANPVWTNFTVSLDTPGQNPERHQVRGWFNNDVDAEVFAPSFSSDGSWVTFLARNKLLQEQADDSFAIQVYRASVIDGVPMNNILNSAKQATDVLAAWKSLPVVSDAGEILYASLGTNVSQADTEMSDNPDDWTIYLVDNSGTHIDVAKGRYPHWLGNDGFVYLTGEGLYYHDLTNDKDSVLLTTDQLPVDFTDITLDVSNDSSTLLISSTLADLTNVYQISQYTDNGVSLTLQYSLSKKGGRWPVISPNNQYFGVVRIDPTPHYVFYPVDGEQGSVTDTEPYVVDLSTYDVSSVIMTDWR